MKAVTFSYDDGVTQDIRLIEMLNKYGLKCTFNLNSDLLGKSQVLVREAQQVNHIKVAAGDVRSVYDGHEVAVHTLTHANLDKCNDEEIIHEVEKDRLHLSELVGYEVVGMAYPCHTPTNERVEKVVREHTGVRYARTTTSTYSFDVQDNLYFFKPTVYHHREWDAMFSLGRKFLEMEADRPQVFYIWGHAYEFDLHNTWDRFEEFCKLISGRNDIFYGTNREVLL